MNTFIKLAFLFFIGSLCGWVLELFFRKFISTDNPQHKWINPGFCTGPYLPIYGCGLCTLYLLACTEPSAGEGNIVLNKTIILIGMAVSMTAIEYIAGLIMLKFTKVRLWDYSNEWGNIQGIICPKFSVFWAALGAFYYFLIHPHILGAIDWLSNNLAFSFVIGLFFGVFIIDIVHSARIVVKLKQFADENDVTLRYEVLKAKIHLINEERKEKIHFFFPFHIEKSLPEFLKEHKDSLELYKIKIKRNGE